MADNVFNTNLPTSTDLFDKKTNETVSFPQLIEDTIGITSSSHKNTIKPKAMTTSDDGTDDIDNKVRVSKYRLKK